MALTLPAAERTVRRRTCECCGKRRAEVTGYVYQDGDAHAVYFASCYPHDGEAFIDVILGTWGEDGASDHVTFGCRVGPIAGQPGPACSLVPAASVAPDHPLFGDKLDRERALAHPWLPTFWEVVDLIMTDDKTVHQNVYPAARRARWWLPWRSHR